MNCFSAKAKVGNTAHRLHSLIRKPYNLHFAHGFEFKSKMMMMILSNSFVVKKCHQPICCELSHIKFKNTRCKWYNLIIWQSDKPNLNLSLEKRKNMQFFQNWKKFGFFLSTKMSMVIYEWNMHTSTRRFFKKFGLGRPLSSDSGPFFKK